MARVNKFTRLQVYYCFALFINNYIHNKYITRRRHKQTKSNTSSQKQNVCSDQSSLDFRVGHCHGQLIGINMYRHLQEQSLES